MLRARQSLNTITNISSLRDKNSRQVVVIIDLPEILFKPFKSSYDIVRFPVPFVQAQGMIDIIRIYRRH